MKASTYPTKFDRNMLIEKLPKSWTDYQNKLKYKQKNCTVEEFVKHILIENLNRKELRVGKTKEMAMKANLVQNNNKRAMPINPKISRPIIPTLIKERQLPHLWKTRTSCCPMHVRKER